MELDEDQWIATTTPDQVLAVDEALYTVTVIGSASAGTSPRSISREEMGRVQGFIAT
jgi:hypothetical protein